MKVVVYQQSREENAERAAPAGVRRWIPVIRAFNPEEISAGVPPGTSVTGHDGDGLGTDRTSYTPIGLDACNADPC